MRPVRWIDRCDCNGQAAFAGIPQHLFQKKRYEKLLGTGSAGKLHVLFSRPGLWDDSDVKFGKVALVYIRFSNRNLNVDDLLGIS